MRLLWVLVAAIGGCLIAAQSPAAPDCQSTRAVLGLPHRLPDVDNPHVARQVALGRMLFVDPALSADGTISCASCHRPEYGFTDRLAVAVGLKQRRGTRNTPTILNAAFLPSFFWDGRRASLEEQVLDPFVNPNEHGLGDAAAVIARVRRSARYREQFQEAFQLDAREIDAGHIALALATFVRSLAAGDSPFDRYAYGCDRSALGESAKRGLALFQGRARCGDCHTVGPHEAMFSDGQYHSVGVGLDRVVSRLASLARLVAQTPRADVDTLIAEDADVAALGRFVVTLDPADIGKFRTPSLRNVAATAPYMHDGSVATLEEAIDRELYYRGLKLGRPIVLTPAEKADLLAFLKSLTSLHIASYSDG